MQRSGGSGETDCFLSVLFTFSASFQRRLLSVCTAHADAHTTRQAWNVNTHTGKTHRNRDEHTQKTKTNNLIRFIWMWIINIFKKTALQHISCYFMSCINSYINRHINTECYIHTCDYTETHKGNAIVMVRHLLLCSGSSFWLTTCMEELQCMEWKMRWIIRFD